MLIELDDVTLDVHDSGTGPPIVLLHGWPDTHHVWRHQVPALRDDGYRVITPDLRGFGGSSHPTTVDAYTAPTMVGDVIGLLDHLAIDRAHLIGHDWGAAIAWLTAGLAPIGSPPSPRCRSATPPRCGTPGGGSGNCPGTCCCSSSPASPSSG